MFETEGHPIITHNRLLSQLSSEDLIPLATKLEPVELSARQILYEAGAPLSHVYFPSTSVMAMTAPLTGRPRIEVATVGNEGMIGVRALLGADTAPAQVLVQIPGSALRMKSSDLHAEATIGSRLLPVLFRYANAFLTQLFQSVACNMAHSLDKRLCRWLLMTQDRVRSDRFPMTHEMLAAMLGVRRASVTEAAGKLQSAGMIRYTHGKITILDRSALESASCECYRVVRADFDRLLG